MVWESKETATANSMIPAHAVHRPTFDHASVTPSIFATPAVFSIEAVSLLLVVASATGSFFSDSPCILVLYCQIQRLGRRAIDERIRSSVVVRGT